MSEMELRDLSELKMEDFSSTLNDTYKCTEPLAGDITLAEVVPLTKQDDSRVTKAPFVLVFHAPASFPTQQGIFHISHSSIGALALFLVPVGKTTDSVIFEATFT